MLAKSLPLFVVWAALTAAAPQASAVNITAFPSSVADDLSTLDQNVGVVGFQQEDFEDGLLASGLELELFDGSTSLGPAPVAIDFGAPWDGDLVATNSLQPNGVGSNVASRLVISLPQGVVSLGFGLSGFQSVNPPTPAGDAAITDHQLLVNGEVVGTTLEALFAPGDWTPSARGRNGYLRIDAEPGEVINSIELRNLMTVTNSQGQPAGDLFQIDRLAFAAVPEPAGIVLAALAFAGLSRRARRADRLR